MASIEDTGIYKCVAVNEVGFAEKDFNVTILGIIDVLDFKNYVKSWLSILIFFPFSPSKHNRSKCGRINQG